MTGLIIFLLVVWVGLAVLGIVLKGLFWLTVVALALLAATGIWGWARRNTSTT